MKKVLTIAGSDSSGGAGIEADLKTFSAFGVYGMAAITAVTAQNTVGVQRVFDLPPPMVGAQLDSVLGDVGTDAVKTGMLANRSIIEVVVGKLKEYGAKNLVVDPVMESGSGYALLRVEDRHCLKDLLALAVLVTPNLEEAQFLSGVEVRTVDGMREAAQAIHKLGSENVLIKGGHLRGDPIDILYDGSRFKEFKGERIPVQAHGTGCAFSAAIAARLARGDDMEVAIGTAKSYISRAIEMSLRVGGGSLSVNHLVLR